MLVTMGTQTSAHIDSTSIIHELLKASMAAISLLELNIEIK